MKISAFQQMVDFAKQKANPVIDQLNIWSRAIGKDNPLPHFTTIGERDADAYVRATEAARALRSGDFTNSPRNNNYVYRGVLNQPKKTIVKPAQAAARTMPSPTYFPTATPTRVPTRLPTAIPTATRAPISSITPAPQAPGGMFDFSGYTISKPGFEGRTIPQPPQDIARIIMSVFGPSNEATPAAAVAWSENGLYNPRAMGAPNRGGTVDYGIFQINSGTFDGLKKRRPQEMAAIGASRYEDLFNPEINARVAALLRKDEQWAGGRPWGQWYGWQQPPLGKGINLQEMIRKLSEDKKKKKK